MTRSVQFRTLPVFGADERQVAEVVRGIMDGKTNNTGTITLATGNATTTTLYDGRIGNESLIFFVPVSDAAEADAAPYGAFQDTTDQSAANTTTAYAVTFNTTDYSSGVYISNSSRINVRNYGIYNIQFSFQFKNTSNDGQDVDIWFRKNGTDIANSATITNIPKAADGGAQFFQIVIYEQVTAGQYIEIMWLPEDADVTIDYTAAGAIAPAIPSIILAAERIA
jgi:hypothetical protein